MKVLVTGATGFLGHAVCRALLHAGLSVIAAVRKQPADLVSGCHSIAVGNIDGTTNWRAALDGIDTVVHLAARTHATDGDDSVAAYRQINVDGTRALAEAAVAAAVPRFVFMSSVKVNGESSPPDADGNPKPLSGDDEARPTTDYGRTKWEAEKILCGIAAKSGMALVVLRPPLVYGAEQKANMLRLMRIVDQGVPLPFANLRNRRSLIYVENLAAAVVCAVQAPASGTYTLADVELSTGDLIRAIAGALGRRARLFPLPLRFVGFVARAAGRGDQFARLTGSLVVERQRIAEDLGWSPTVAFERALEDTAAWYRASEHAR